MEKRHSFLNHRRKYFNLLKTCLKSCATQKQEQLGFNPTIHTKPTYVISLLLSSLSHVYRKVNISESNICVCMCVCVCVCVRACLRSYTNLPKPVSPNLIFSSQIPNSHSFRSFVRSTHSLEDYPLFHSLRKTTIEKFWNKKPLSN